MWIASGCQTALARLGYYDGKIDGIFGPDSRAAIRRYQHELGADDDRPSHRDTGEPAHCRRMSNEASAWA